MNNGTNVQVTTTPRILFIELTDAEAAEVTQKSTADSTQVNYKVTQRLLDTIKQHDQDHGKTST